MQLSLQSSQITGSTDPITVWDVKRFAAARHHPHIQQLYAIIDGLGQGSKVSQGINAVLTSVERLCSSPSHRIYLLCVDRRAIGILKVGVKKLFIRRRTGALVEMDPLCVLDFYVHESEQRNGWGRLLFDHMLSQEGVQPSQLAIDKPSAKFLYFLRKHYNLADYDPQQNNFVVFHQYFDSGAATTSVQPQPQQSGGQRLNASRAAPMLQPLPIPLQPMSSNTMDHRPPQLGGSSVNATNETAPVTLPQGPSTQHVQGGNSFRGRASSREVLSASLCATEVGRASVGCAPNVGVVARGRGHSPTRSYNIITNLGCSDPEVPLQGTRLRR